MKVSFVGAANERNKKPQLTAETVMVMPYTQPDLARRAATLLASRSGVKDGVLLAIEDTDHEGFIAVVNRAFEATESTYFGYVAQDAFPGRQWLALAVEALRQRGKHLFAFNDGKWMGALAGFGLATRAWAADNYDGALFYPGYQRHYADCELTVLALAEQAFGYNANSVLVEVDWEKDKKGVNTADRNLYLDRAQTGFGGRVIAPELIRMFS
ncbi:MAG: hypothetical protein NT123_19145 [Proteobacteria bacterium]|nr:hypothetical protein [Pseudomonadota bacterium]